VENFLLKEKQRREILLINGKFIDVKFSNFEKKLILVKKLF